MPEAEYQVVHVQGYDKYVNVTKEGKKKGKLPRRMREALPELKVKTAKPTGTKKLKEMVRKANKKARMKMEQEGSGARRYRRLM
jgi:hypothetical protein